MLHKIQCNSATFVLCRDELFAMADIVTPNVKEASRLLGGVSLRTVSDMRNAAESIYKFGPKYVCHIFMNIMLLFLSSSSYLLHMHFSVLLHPYICPNNVVSILVINFFLIFHVWIYKSLSSRIRRINLYLPLGLSLTVLHESECCILYSQAFIR